jgi:hypothetical protein
MTELHRQAAAELLHFQMADQRIQTLLDNMRRLLDLNGHREACRSCNREIWQVSTASRVGIPAGSFQADGARHDCAGDDLKK